MDKHPDLRALLLAFRDAEQRAEYHHDRAEVLEREAATLRQRLRQLVTSEIQSCSGP